MRAPAGLLLLGAAGVLLTVCLFFGGGLSSGRLFWIGMFAQVIGFGTVAAALVGALPLRPPRRVAAAALGLLAAFVAWSGASMGWSIAADLSWAAFNRGLVYLAFAVLGYACATLVPRPARSVAASLAALLLGVVGWALLGKVFPSLFPDGGRVARLREPIGYWNALALVCALALPLGLWLATRRSWRRQARVAGVVLLYLAVIALVLTYSRAGIAVAVVAVLLWLALVPARLESLGALVVAVVPAAAVAGWASTRPGIADDGQPLGVRRHDGAWFALVTIIAGLAVVAAALWADRQDRSFADTALRRLWARRIGAVVAVLAVAGVVAASAASGGPGRWLDEFRGGVQVGTRSSRLGELSSDNRWSWWQEAWRLFEQAPGLGKGAATFSIARRSVRTSGIVTNEPHDIALQALAETGIVGCLLGAGATLTALAAATAAVRRLSGEERAAAVALAIALPTYVLHALVDIDWEFVAVSGPVFFLGGLASGLGGRGPAWERAGARLRLRPLLAAGAVACLLGGAYSLLAPWLATKRVQDAEAATLAGDPRAGAARARDAISLNPFSVDAVWQLALAYEQAGDREAAVREYERAARLQPANSSTWLALGSYDYCIGRYHDAYVALNQAYTLDPYGPAGIPGGMLDRARAKVNAGVNRVPPSQASCES